MLGIGRVTTSSPTRPTTRLPVSSHASIATPRQPAETSPGHTGTVGAPPANAPTTSVPPLIETSGMWLPTFSDAQYEALAGRGDPVDTIWRSAERSSCRLGCTPVFAVAARNPGLVPKSVIR